MSGSQVDYQRIYKAVPLFRGLEEGDLDQLLKISRLFRAAEGHGL